MTSKSAIFLVLFLPLLLTSCFEIREELDWNTDGSGKITLTLDFQESKNTVASYLESGEVQGQMVPGKDEIVRKLNILLTALEGIDGVSKVSKIVDFKKYVLSVSAVFADLQSLNKVVSLIGKEIGKDWPIPAAKGEMFKIEQSVFYQLFPYPYKAIEEEAYQAMNPIHRFTLETARFVQIFRFDRPLRAISNATAQIAPSNKAVRIEHSLADLFTGSVIPESAIEF